MQQLWPRTVMLALLVVLVGLIVRFGPTPARPVPLTPNERLEAVQRAHQSAFQARVPGFLRQIQAVGEGALVPRFDLGPCTLEAERAVWVVDVDSFAAVRPEDVRAPEAPNPALLRRVADPDQAELIATQAEGTPPPQTLGAISIEVVEPPLLDLHTYEYTPGLARGTAVLASADEICVGLAEARLKPRAEGAAEPTGSARRNLQAQARAAAIQQLRPAHSADGS